MVIKKWQGTMTHKDTSGSIICCCGNRDWIVTGRLCISAYLSTIVRNVDATSNVAPSENRMEQNEEQTGVHAVGYELTVDYMGEHNRCSLRRILMQPSSEHRLLKHNDCRGKYGATRGHGEIGARSKRGLEWVLLNVKDDCNAIQ